MSDKGEAWIEIDGARINVRRAWIIPTDAEFVSYDPDGNPVFWAADHLEAGTRIF